MKAARDIYSIDPGALVIVKPALVGLFGANATITELEMLGLHNFVEHDASLTRSDFYFDSATYLDLNATLLADFLPDKSAMIDRGDIVVARQARINYSRSNNPTFNWTSALSHGAAASRENWVSSDSVSMEIWSSMVESSAMRASFK